MMTIPELEQREVAHRELAKAVRTGLLKRPSRCQNCGTVPTDGNIHGHHEDYSKPLLIEWLCVPCHGAKKQCAATEVAACEAECSRSGAPSEARGFNHRGHQQLPRREAGWP